MKKNSITFFFFLLSFSFWAQKPLLKDSIIHQIEDFILADKIKNASHLLSVHKNLTTGNYGATLNEIVNGKSSYKNYYTFTSKVSNRIGLDYQKISNYINKKILVPSDVRRINLDFVRIKWLQINKLRDEKTIEDASKEQTKLDTYISKFDAKDIDVQKAEILASTHQIVLYVIGEKVKKGKDLCLSNLKKSRELGDKELEITSLFYLCDFLIFEGKLDEYIETCKKIVEIEKKLEFQSAYHLGNIIHLIDAYIYKGGFNDKVLELLNELYEKSETRNLSYSLYAKLLGGLQEKSPVYISILKQFNTTDLVSFVKKIELEGKGILNPNDFFQLNREVAIMLERHGLLKEAMDYIKKSNSLIKKIYSEDLANSLANFKTAQAVKEKEKEIKIAKERSNLYLIIGLLSIGFLIISIFILRLRKKRNIILKEKNQVIEHTLQEKNKLLQEKELLVREIHHRVKNNFQIVSSLLELQTKGIEDPKAKELANEGQLRIKSMALIHQKLYQQDNGFIDFKEYIVLLVKELSSLLSSDKIIETNVNITNISFDVDTAIPLGLIINELITNAYKYAFNDNKDGKLSIQIEKHSNDSFLLSVADNGPGFNKDFDIKKVRSLGMRLIYRLTRQLQGKVTITNDNGTKIAIVFKDTYQRKSID